MATSPLSPSPQFRYGTGEEGHILQPPASVVSTVTAHKTFVPTDLTSTYSVCICWHRTYAFRSRVQCSKHYATTSAFDGRVRVWRQPHESMDFTCQQGTVQAGRGYVMVWGV
ncbi:hypothetical protein TNCV_1039181 [Trichonephila clavipes]|uniref:Uncharacterized protein n=1 Tax=Trichonephila clavipes TaxID=2585209 RepID=A0A8X6VWC3_TRICX|nr:hypothetical protein TNCV_1039181 [Trichonephila clavipes]